MLYINIVILIFVIYGFLISSVFSTDFNMADTFFSWFLVTELHLWMIMVRYMAEGNAGRLVRNSVVNTLWEDTKARAINLGVSNIVLLVHYISCDIFPYYL